MLEVSEEMLQVMLSLCLGWCHLGQPLPPFVEQPVSTAGIAVILSPLSRAVGSGG